MTRKQRIKKDVKEALRVLVNALRSKKGQVTKISHNIESLQSSLDCEHKFKKVKELHDRDCFVCTKCDWNDWRVHR